VESTTEMSSAFYIYHICITILVLWYIGIFPQQQNQPNKFHICLTQNQQNIPLPPLDKEKAGHSVGQHKNYQQKSNTTENQSAVESEDAFWILKTGKMHYNFNHKEVNGQSYHWLTKAQLKTTIVYCKWWLQSNSGRVLRTFLPFTWNQMPQNIEALRNGPCTLKRK